MGTTDINRHLHANDDDAPKLGPENAPTFPGNLHDDDGQVIDAMFRTNVEGPERNELPVTQTLALPDKVQPVQTRMQCVTLNIAGNSAWTPVQVFPADPNRLRMYITYNNKGNTRESLGVLLGSSSAAVQSMASSFLIQLPGGGLGVPMEVCDYTGEVWINVGSLAQDSQLSFMAISKGSVLS